MSLDKIYTTTDYSIFSPMMYNRGQAPINKRHFAQLEKSILEKNLLGSRPIIVNEKMIIIDGHHRLEVAKKHGLEISYLIAPETSYLDSIRLTRGTTDWSLKGYIDCRAAYGEPEFKKLRDFLLVNDITCHTLFRLLSRTGRRRSIVRTIRDGTFKFTEEMEELKPYIETIHQVMKWATEVGIPYRAINNSEFWYGCFAVITHPSCRLPRFMFRTENSIQSLCKEFSSWKSVATSLVKIYNHDIQESKKLMINEITDRNSHRTDLSKFEAS